MYETAAIEATFEAPAPGTYVEHVLRALEPDGHREALVHDDRRICRQEARETVYRMARALRALGIVRGDSVAVLAVSPPEVVLLQLAVHLLGCRYVAVHPRVPLSEQAALLGIARPAALVYDPRYFADRALVLGQASAATHLLSFGPADAGANLLWLAKRESGASLPAAAQDDVSAVFYTAGTTRRPKLVLHTHACYGATVALHLFRAAANGAGPPRHRVVQNERLLLCTPATHGSGQLTVLLTLLAGGTVILMEEINAANVLDTLVRERATTLFLTPPLLYQLLDLPALAGADTRALTRITYGAAPASAARLAEAIQRFGPILRQTYGCAEAPLISMLDPAAHSRRELLGSAGRPVPGMQVSIRDEGGGEVAAGEVGEVWVRGVAVMAGYLAEPEPDTRTLRDGWLRTGDLGRLDLDGYLHLVGTGKDIIHTGDASTTVDARTVEDLLATHPDVLTSAVIGIPDEVRGEAVHAVVVPRAGRHPDPARLGAYVRQRLGRRHAPRSVQLLPALPLTALGTVDKRALQEPWWASRGRGYGWSTAARGRRTGSR